MQENLSRVQERVSDLAWLGTGMRPRNSDEPLKTREVGRGYGGTPNSSLVKKFALSKEELNDSARQNQKEKARNFLRTFIVIYFPKKI